MLDWDSWHVQKLLHKDRFHIRYRMPLDDFEAHVEPLGYTIVTKLVQSPKRMRQANMP